MFFTTPQKKKVVTFALVGLLSINTFVGYKIVKANRVELDSPPLQQEINVSGSSITAEAVGEEKISDNLVNIITNVEFYKHICELYDNLISHNIAVTEINRELNNVLLAHLVPTDIPEQTWDIMFNNLMKTVSGDVNVVEYYYPLALYKHVNECELEHTYNVDGTIQCSDMVTSLQNYQVESFENYVIRRVEEMEITTIKDALHRILGYGYSINDVKGELDIIYKVCTVPMGVDETFWYQSFSKLLETVNEFENVCGIYYDLANFIHQIECEYPHYINEFGMTECQKVKGLEL